MKTGIAFAAATLILALQVGPAAAQLDRTWVSAATGNDANPCTRLSPCLTFAGALAETGPGGEINVIDAGEYGPVTIGQAVTIDGGGTFASIAAPAAHGIVVSAGPNDKVILRNLSLNAGGTGLSAIRFLTGRQLAVVNCDIYGFQTGVEMAHTAPGNLAVKDTYISGVTRGLRITAAGGFSIATIKNVSVFGATAAGLEVASGNAFATVVDSVFTGIGGPAVVVSAGTGNINVKSSVLSHNAVGVSAASSGSLIRLTNNLIQNNTTGFSLVGGATIASAGENKTGGNGGAGAPNGSVPLE